MAQVRRTARRTRRIAISISIASIGLGACERKAPGPDECRKASLRLLGITEQERSLNPRAHAAVDELMVECLTTPFDRELTRCLEERGSRVCVQELRRRLHAPVEDDPDEL